MPEHQVTEPVEAGNRALRGRVETGRKAAPALLGTLGSVLALQRTAGNQAVSSLFDRTRSGQAGNVRRDGDSSAAASRQTFYDQDPLPLAGTANVAFQRLDLSPEAPVGNGVVRTPTADQKIAFLAGCTEAGLEIQSSQERFDAWLDNVSTAYTLAWTKHVEVLNKVNAQAGEPDVIVQAALIFLPAGIAGNIGKKVLAPPVGAFLIDGLKDLSKWGMRAAAGSLLSSSGLPSLPSNPLVWRNGIDNRVKTELGMATDQVKTWITKSQSNDADFDLTAFDPAGVMKQALTLGGIPLESLPPVDVNTLQTLFQKGFLEAWIKSPAGAELANDLNDSFPWKAASIEGTLSEYGNSIDVPDVSDRLRVAGYTYRAKEAAAEDEKELEKEGLLPDERLPPQHPLPPLDPVPHPW